MRSRIRCWQSRGASRSTDGWSLGCASCMEDSWDQGKRTWKEEGRSEGGAGRKARLGRTTGGADEGGVCSASRGLIPGRSVFRDFERVSLHPNRVCHPRLRCSLSRALGRRRLVSLALLPFAPCPPLTTPPGPRSRPSLDLARSTAATHFCSVLGQTTILTAAPMRG